MKHLTPPLCFLTVLGCASMSEPSEQRKEGERVYAEEALEAAPSAPEDTTIASRPTRRRRREDAPAPSVPAPSRGESDGRASASFGDDRGVAPPPAPLPKIAEVKKPGASADGEPIPPSFRSADPSSASTTTLAREEPPAEPTRTRTVAPTRLPASPGVKAGASDDNLSYAAFLEFLAKHRHHGYQRDLRDRVIVEVTDQRGKPIPDARIELRRGKQTLQRRRTYADGRALLYPSDTDGVHRQELSVHLAHADLTKTILLADENTHRIQFKLLREREAFDKVPLDVAFVLDTTGSMGDELLRLKQTIETIHFQVENMSPRPDVRFGLVTYRDRNDAYVTEHVPFTRDLGEFTEALARVEAGGGNDYPEDVQAGLEATLHELEWRDTGVKLAFLVGDAPPHFDYGQRFTYVEAAREAAERGIKIATIGASGLSETGEVVWRQVAQYTMAPFVFLTYGEKGDSGGGSPALVSHHVGSNWVAEDLDAIVVRMVKVELAHLTERGAPTREDYFAASRSDEVPKDLVLEDLFSQSVKQLLDYSVERIEPRTPTVLMPISTSKKLGADTNKLGRRLMVGLSRRPQFQLLENEGRDVVLAQLADQLSAKYDASRVADVGKLVPAKLAVLSSLAPGDDGKVEMLVKLVRLETGEVLSLSLLKIDQTLLL